MSNAKVPPAQSPSAQKPRHYRTAQVARAAGVHPNTVRLYESWGFLPPIPRSPKGYRLFTDWHLQLMRLARIALHHPYPGGKAPVLGMLARAKEGDLDGAMAFALQYQHQVGVEREKAESAAELLERWARGELPRGRPRRLRIGEAARMLSVSVDSLRNWERNGLITTGRNPRNGYRYFGSEELDRLEVVRVLRAAGYGCNAIARMLRHLDEAGEGQLRSVLDTTPPDEDVAYCTDRWLTTLAEQAARVEEAMSLLEEMRGITLH